MKVKKYVLCVKSYFKILFFLTDARLGEYNLTYGIIVDVIVFNEMTYKVNLYRTTVVWVENESVKPLYDTITNLHSQ